MGTVSLRKLGRVLLVGSDPATIDQSVLVALKYAGTEVDVVEHDIAAFIRLSDPNHGYNFVFLGSHPRRPDVAKRLLRDQLDIFAD